MGVKAHAVAYDVCQCLTALAHVCRGEAYVVARSACKVDHDLDILFRSSTTTKRLLNLSSKLAPSGVVNTNCSTLHVEDIIFSDMASGMKGGLCLCLVFLPIWVCLSVFHHPVIVYGFILAVLAEIAYIAMLVIVLHHLLKILFAFNDFSW